MQEASSKSKIDNVIDRKKAAHISILYLEKQRWPGVYDVQTFKSGISITHAHSTTSAPARSTKRSIFNDVSYFEQYSYYCNEDSNQKETRTKSMHRTFFWKLR